MSREVRHTETLTLRREGSALAAEGPSMRRRRLGLELKRCREHAGMTQEQVAEHFEWYAAKVMRIETARVSVTARDVRDLLTLYGVEDGEYRDALVELARRSKEKSWWSDYKDVLRRSGAFIGLEAEADSLRTWQPIVMPGLLQTPEYARELLALGLPNPDPESIERRVEVRMTRQKRLSSKEPLHLSAIIDESVLHRAVGGPAVMRGQLEHLLEMGRLPNVNIQVLPLDSRQNTTLGGPAELIEFPEALDLDVVFLEGIAGEYFEEQPAEVARYRRIFERLSASAHSRDATARLITALLEKTT